MFVPRASSTGSAVAAYRGRCSPPTSLDGPADLTVVAELDELPEIRRVRCGYARTTDQAPPVGTGNVSHNARPCLKLW